MQALYHYLSILSTESSRRGKGKTVWVTQKNPRISARAYLLGSGLLGPCVPVPTDQFFHQVVFVYSDEHLPHLGCDCGASVLYVVSRGIVPCFGFDAAQELGVGGGGRQGAPLYLVWVYYTMM